MERKVITVDGLAGSGKSTLAHHLAEKLDYVHFNSGLLYRAVGYLALQNNVKADDAEKVADLMDKIAIDLCRDEAVMIGNNKITAEELHQPNISEAASTSASLPEVRKRLIDVQRNVFPESNLVAEGRDMGTVIFPDSPLKFFITATPEVRVARRLVQLGLDINSQDIENIRHKIEIEILERDKRDSERKIAPTVAASEAVLIDNSSKTLTEVIQTMYDAAAKRGLTD